MARNHREGILFRMIQIETVGWLIPSFWDSFVGPPRRSTISWTLLICSATWFITKRNW